jgi:hypothetical protein
MPRVTELCDVRNEDVWGIFTWPPRAHAPLRERSPANAKRTRQDGLPAEMTTGSTMTKEATQSLWMKLHASAGAAETSWPSTRMHAAIGGRERGRARRRNTPADLHQTARDWR